MTEAHALKLEAAQLSDKAAYLIAKAERLENNEGCQGNWAQSETSNQKSMANCLTPATSPSTSRLDFLFTYHPPTPEQLPRYQAIRTAARRFAEDVLANTPPGRDQDNVIQLIRAAVWTANSAIALDGRS